MTSANTELQVVAAAMLAKGDVRRQLLPMMPDYSFRDRQHGRAYHQIIRALATLPDGYSQQELADASGVSLPAVMLIESESSFIPLRDALQSLYAQRVADSVQGGMDPLIFAEAMVALKADRETVQAGNREPQFISGNDCLSDDARPDYVIAGILETDSTGQMFGPSGHGKSFIKLDMLLSIATARDWYGRQTKQGLVVNFSGEGRKGESRRIKAWTQQNGHHDLSLFVTSQRTVDFDSDMQAAVNEIQAIEEQTGQPCRVIAIDTLSRHLVGDENSTKDMAAFVTRVDWLRTQFPGSVALVIHHTGNDAEKSDRSRGSSALKAACDFEMRVLKGQISFTKMKDAEPPQPIDFKLVPVQIGTTDDGELVTSCVPEYGERSQTHKAVTLTHQEQQAIDALVTVCAANPKQVNGQYVADQEQWRQEFYRLRRIDDSDVKQSALKVAFQRVSGSSDGAGLRGKKIIAFSENGVTPLRLNEQEIISKKVPADGTRNIDGTLTEHVPLTSPNRRNGTEHTPIGVFRVPLRCSADVPVLEVDL